MSSLPVGWCLPMGWKLRPFGEVATLQRGFDLPIQDRREGSIKIFAANGPVGTHNVHQVRGPGVVTGRSGSIGKVHYVDEDYWPLNTALWVKDFHGNDPKWVARMITWLGLEQFIRGVGVPTLNRNLVHEVTIPLPPLEEQKRIAAILDQADALRRLRARAMDRLNALGQAIFHEMFGSSPDRHIRKLNQVADLINGDRSSNYPSGEEIKSEGVPFLSTKNIRGGQLSLEKCQFITMEKFASLTRGKLKRGDLVITLRGTLGQAAIFDCGFETGFINAQMMIIRPKTGISSQYLLDFISLGRTQHELMRGQSGSAVKQLTAGQVGELDIVVPSNEQQSIYTRRTSEMRDLIGLAEGAAVQAGTLFTSLQHRAFRGEL